MFPSKPPLFVAGNLVDDKSDKVNPPLFCWLSIKLLKLPPNSIDIIVGSRSNLAIGWYFFMLPIP